LVCFFPTKQTHIFFDADAGRKRLLPPAYPGRITATFWEGFCQKNIGDIFVKIILKQLTNF
jgi:hypothetical protein